MSKLKFIALLFLFLGIGVSEIQAQDLSGEPGDWRWEREYSIEVTTQGTVSFEEFNGSAGISGSDSRFIVIREIIPIQSEAREEAREVGEGFALDILSDSDYIMIESPGTVNGTRYEILVPSGITVHFESNGGAIAAIDLDAYLNIDTGGGAVKIQDVAGPIDVRSDGGNVNVAYSSGDVTISTSGGQITVSNIEGEVSATTGGGQVVVRNVEDGVDIVTAGGNVEVGDVEGDVSVLTAAGNIDVDHVGGRVTVSSGGGDIDLIAISGAIRASTNGGDIEGRQLKSEMRLETLAGDIDLEEIRSEVRAITEVGNVDVTVINTSFLSKGSLIIDVGHGEIDIRLPQNVRADILATVGQSGTIEVARSGWDVEVLRQRPNIRRNEVRRLELEIGGGGGEISLSLQAGDIYVRNR